MKLVQKGDFDDNPKIPEDYYVSMLEDIRHYERDEAESMGLILDFRVKHDGEEVVLPFFAPAKLSVSEERESSRLAENLERIGLLETVLQVIDDSGDLSEKVLGQSHKLVAADEEDADELKDALTAVLKGKKIRVNVEDSQDGEESQVSKLSKVFDEDADESGEDDREAIFDDEDDTEHGDEEPGIVDE